MREPNTCYFAGMQVVEVDPIDCSVEVGQAPAPTATPKFGRHQTQSAAVILQTDLQGYMCHNSHRLRHWVVKAFRNERNVVPVGLHMVDTLRT
jgi:hypothetical protein